MKRPWRTRSAALALVLGALAACTATPPPADCRLAGGGRFAICGAGAGDDIGEPAEDADPLDAEADPDLPPEVDGDDPGADPTLDAAEEAVDDPLPDSPVEEPTASDPDLSGEDLADVEPSLCPADMVQVESICMDRYEAPNQQGEVPFVMFHLYEAEAWCEARGKRLCYDDEWSLACGGTEELTYPYGNQRVAGRCNDEEVWREYVQSLLNGWPHAASTAEMETLADQLAAARGVGSSAAAAADHIELLYQGEAAGDNPQCVGEYGVYDLVGNVEEWTLRRDGGSGTEFTGRLLGRYWAESRTCHGGVTSHGNGFRFYEIGFRCCLDPE